MDVESPGDEMASPTRETRVLVPPPCEEVGQTDSANMKLLARLTDNKPVGQVRRLARLTSD